jgi:septum formation protein
MIWNFSDKSELKMKDLRDEEIDSYLSKIKTDTLLNYGVYQIEANGKELFEYIKGDENSIMGLPIEKIKQYLKNYKK